MSIKECDVDQSRLRSKTRLCTDLMLCKLMQYAFLGERALHLEYAGMNLALGKGADDDG